jgi:hypothetical protein
MQPRGCDPIERNTMDDKKQDLSVQKEGALGHPEIKTGVQTGNSDFIHLDAVEAALREA